MYITLLGDLQTIVQKTQSQTKHRTLRYSGAILIARAAVFVVVLIAAQLWQILVAHAPIQLHIQDLIVIAIDNCVEQQSLAFSEVAQR